MKFIADIDIMPHRELLDPQGKTVTNNLKNLSLTGIDHVRIGKHVTMEVEADNEAAAGEMVETACRKILANAIMEGYTFSLRPA